MSCRRCCRGTGRPATLEQSPAKQRSRRFSSYRVPIRVRGDSHPYWHAPSPSALIVNSNPTLSAPHRLRFTVATGLINELAELAHANQLRRALARWERLDLICIVATRLRKSAKVDA